MARLDRLSAAARLSRRFSTAESSGNADKLSRWLKEWLAVPRVVAPEGAEPPTALSWLRRRGPPLPESALHKLFRQQTVRLYDPASQRVCRVSKARQLPPGATLLLPKTAVAAATPGSSAGGRGKEGASARSGASTGGDGTSSRSAPRSLASQQAQAWLARLRGGVLHQDPDFLAINKPAGLACQGGSGLALSLDGLMGEAFGGVPGVQAEQLRLVHRLDKQTTGALLIAQNPDAAAWLATAFKEGSLSSDGSSSGGSSSAGGSGGGSSSGRRAGRAAQPPPAGPVPAIIRKTYWAVVARGEEEEKPGAAARATRRPASGDSWLPRSGRISLPVPGGKGPGELVPAETRFKALHRGPRLAWLELRPSTGRKHQLRLHCARGLGAAILGDARYGQVRSGAQAAALAALQRSQGSARAGGSDPPLFLHCRQLEVRRPGGRQPAVRVAAPLPDAWRAMLAQQGWPLPPEPATQLDAA